MSARNVALLLAGLMLAAQPSQAQTRARLLLGGGTATDLQGVRSGAWLFAPSLSFAPDRNAVVALGGRFTRFTDQGWSVGGTAATALRLPVASTVGILLTGNGDLVRTSYHATYLSATGIPALEWRPGGLTLWAGFRLATARTTLDSRLPLSPRPPLTLSGSGPAFGAGYQWPGITLGYREEHSRPGGSSVTDRTVSLTLTRGPVSVGGSLGLRRGEAEQRTFGSANLSLTLVGGVDLVATAERYPSNLLTGTLPGRALTAGLSLGFGGPRGSPAFPRPAGVPPLPAGMTRLAYTAPEAERVEVAGDWNRWHPQALARTGNGVWYLDLAIPAGYYRYAFRVNGTNWKVPKGVAAVDDGFGGKSAWLSVSEPGRTASQSANRKEAP